jgi:hypothetical protein
MSLTQIFYDKPSSHSNIQTRWTLPAGKHIYAPSIKILDLGIVLDELSYFPALVGAYGLIKKVQVRLNNRLVDIWNAQQLLPLLVALSGDNEKQVGINSVLYGSGNNVNYDPVSKLLQLERDLVHDKKYSLKLSVYSDLLNNIGIITDALEIIVDWETDLKKCTVPLDPATPPTTIEVLAPYLSYETFNDPAYTQPSEVPFRMWVLDQFSIPAIETSNTQQQYEIRSNAFNNHVVGRLVLVNTPAALTVGTPDIDMEELYNVFGFYQSTPMAKENFNIAVDGKSILTFRNVNNNATKASLLADAFGPTVFSTLAHVHSVQSPLLELQGAVLNGYASIGCAEINGRVSKELALTYRRSSDNNVTVPSLATALTISCIAEVKCMLKDGLKSYL